MLDVVMVHRYLYLEMAVYIYKKYWEVILILLD
nr:MAG TPA: hypothetical protein [Caudoviricetes sp.]DAM18779.1 MAG TPA: hypothetical protein [Caudoviricetes sp.]